MKKRYIGHQIHLSQTTEAQKILLFFILFWLKLMKKWINIRKITLNTNAISRITFKNYLLKKNEKSYIGQRWHNSIYHFLISTHGFQKISIVFFTLKLKISTNFASHDFCLLDFAQLYLILLNFILVALSVKSTQLNKITVILSTLSIILCISPSFAVRNFYAAFSREKKDCSKNRHTMAIMYV